MDPDEIIRRLMERSGDASVPVSLDTPRARGSAPEVAPTASTSSIAERGLAEAIGAAPRARVPTRRVDITEPMRIEARGPAPYRRTDTPQRSDDEDFDATIGDEAFGAFDGGPTPRETLADIAASAADVPGSLAEGALPGIIPLVGGVHGVLTGEGPVGERYQSGRRHGQDLLDAARARSPETTSAMDIAGMLSALIPSGGSRAGASFAQRAAAPVAMGATYGLVGSQSGQEDSTAADTAGETTIGAAIPLAIEGLVHGGGRVARSVARSAPYQRIASLLGERFGNGSSREVERVVRDIGRGDPERAASMIEDLGLVGPTSTVDDVVERSRGALTEAEAATGARRAAFHDAGHRVPTETLPAALESEADRMEMRPRRARYAPRVREEASAARRALQRLEAPIPGGTPASRAAETELERARAGLAAVPPPPALAEIASRDDELARMQRELADRGVPEGSDAYAREMRRGERDIFGMSQTGDVGQHAPLPQSPDDLLTARQAASDRVDVAGRDAARAARSTTLAQHEDALEPIRDLAGFRSIAEPQSAQRAWRDALRSGRSAVDRVVEETLPASEAGEFAAERARVQASRLGLDLSTRRAQRAALRSPLSQMMLPALLATALGGGAGAIGGSESGAGPAGSGALGAIGAGFGYRALRGRDAAIFATTSRIVQRLVESGTAGRVLGRAGELLERAATRGALPVVHRMLMQDPQYVQTVEQLAEEPDAPADPFFEPSAEASP
jgi:hypothetical protein